MSEALTMKAVATRCHGAKQHGDHWVARCPAHEDKSPSLKVSNGRKGVLIYCHAGCHIDDVCAAIGISKRELFYDYSENGSAPPTESMRKLMDKLVADSIPIPIEWNHPMDVIMFDALASERLPADVWERSLAQAGVEYPWLMSIEYEEAMQYPGLVANGPLFTFLRPLWEHLGRPSWLTLADQAFKKMTETYEKKVEENQP